MTIEFIWQLPTSGDGRYGNAEITRRGERSSDVHPYSPGVSDPRGNRFNYFDYLHQVARASDLAGFDGVRIPEDPNGDEPWIVAGYISRGTKHLKLLTEFEASRGSSVYAAKNAVSFQRFTGGRFAWQISKGGNEKARQALGDFIPEADISQRIEEFVTVARGVLTETNYSYKGQYFEVLNGGFQGALGNQKVPPVYLSGNSEASYELSAKVANYHVFDALPLTELEAEIVILNGKLRAHGRSVALGLRIDIIARETEKEAVFDARRIWEQSGQKQGIGDPVISHHLWSGLSSATNGAKATLVGSYEQVAQFLIDYSKAGITSFQLSAVPHFEEAYRIGEFVLPLVRSQITKVHRQVA